MDNNNIEIMTYHTCAVCKPRLVSDVHRCSLVHETSVDDRHLCIFGQIAEQRCGYFEEAQRGLDVGESIAEIRAERKSDGMQ